MPNDTTTNIQLPYIYNNQAQKEVLVNEAFTTIDSLLNNGAVTKALSTPPGSPVDGQIYIIGASATGAWAGHDLDIAIYSSGWRFIDAREGLTLWVNDENKSYSFDGSAWILNRTVPSFTTGSVIFSNSTNITEDNSNLFWDNTGKKLGVGTVTPAAIIEAKGTSENLRLSYNGSNYSSFNTDSSGNLNISATGANLVTSTITGSNSASGNLVLKSTTNATKGFIYFGSSFYDGTFDYHKVLNTNLGAAPVTTSGFYTANTTAAASGLQQASGSVTWEGQGWKTTATAASQPVAFQSFVLPVQGTTAPTGNWVLQAAVNGGAFASALTVSSAGLLTATSLTIAGQLATSSTVASSNLLTAAATSGQGVSASTTSRFLFSGASSVNYRILLGGASSTVLTASNSYATVTIGDAAVTEAASGAHALIAQQVIKALTVTAGVATVTNTAGLYIEGAPNAVVTGAQYGLWVDAGISRLDGYTDHQAGMGAAIATVSVDTTLDNTYYTVLVNATSANRTITLPAAASSARMIYNIKKIDSSANTVTIDANASETIDGTLTKVITAQWVSYQIQCDGTSWYIL